MGEYRERHTAQSRLFESAIIAGPLILLLLQASFRRWRLAVLTFLTLPMVLVGGVLAAWLACGIISLGSLVAARNGILLINHCQHPGRAGGNDVRPGPGAARCPPAAVTDLDDVAGHGTGTGPAGRAGPAAGNYRLSIRNRPLDARSTAFRRAGSHRRTAKPPSE